MSIINYTQNAVLGAYQTWLMQQGAQACLDKRIIGQEPPPRPLAGCGPYAQAGTSIRYTVSTTLASANVFFSGQFLTDTGKWQSVGETVTATSAGGVVQVVRPATAGSYANMVASVGSATVGAGEVYVVAELGRQNNAQFTPYAVLFKGYPESQSPLDLCAGTFTQNTPPASGGGGCCISTTYNDDFLDLLNPQYTITVPAGKQARVVSMNGSYAAGPTAGNRLVVADILSGAGLAYESRGISVQTANQNRAYYWQVGSERYAEATGGANMLPLPESLWLSGPVTIDILADNFKADDVWTRIDIMYELK